MADVTCLCLAHAAALERYASAVRQSHDKGNHLSSGTFPPELRLEEEEAEVDA